MTSPRSLKNTARFAGLLYLVWIVSGLFAMFYIPGRIDMRADAATVSVNVLSNESLFRAGIVNDLFSATLWVVMVLVFYRMFKDVDVRQARLLVALVIVQIPVAFFMGACEIASLMIFKGELLKSFEPVQRQEMAMVFLKINDYGVWVLETFWGLWLFPLGILAYKSGFLPRFIGIWLLITGVFYLGLGFTTIMLPQYKDLILHGVFALPAEVGEVALMLWLVIVGAKPRTSHTQATR